MTWEPEDKTVYIDRITLLLTRDNLDSEDIRVLAGLKSRIEAGQIMTERRAHALENFYIEKTS